MKAQASFLFQPYPINLSFSLLIFSAKNDKLAWSIESDSIFQNYYKQKASRYLSVLQLSFSPFIIFLTAEMKKENEYTITDLSRALIREYLNQKGLKNTLECFEREDKHNRKKINRNLLIEMTSLKALCLINKRLPDSQSSLLQVLVAYLNKKYQVKKNTFTKTEPQFYQKNETDLSKNNPPKNETTQLYPAKYDHKKRPSTSKPHRNKQESSHNPPQTFEKEQLKVIYNKVSKIEETLKFRPLGLPQLIKKVENTEVTTEKAAKTVKEIQKQAEKMEITVQKAEKNEKVEEEIKDANSFPSYHVLEIEQQYQQQFQEDQPAKRANISQTPTFFTIKEDFQPPLPKIEEEKFQSSIGPSYTQFKAKAEDQLILNTGQKIRELQTNIEQQSIDNLKEGRTIFSTFYEEQTKNYESKIKMEMDHNLSEQKLNPIPCLHSNQLKVRQQQHNLADNKNQKEIMGCIAAEIPEMGKPLEAVKEEPEVKEKDQGEPEQVSKPRTQMRLLGKGKSNKQIPAVEKEENSKSDLVKEQVSPVFKIEEKIVKPQQIKIEIKPKEQPQKPTVMVSIGKKKKNKEGQNQNQYPTKFKFDENFSHDIPTEVKYQYEPYNLGPLVIEQKVEELYPSMVFQAGINYKVKGGGVPALKKKQEKGITSKEAQKLKKIVFQSGPSLLPKAWGQGFILSPFQSTPYGLKQIEGGPCGVIAAVQCYFLKHLLFCQKDSNIRDDTVRQVCLVAALTNLLWKIKSTDKLFLAFPPKGSSKIDINNLKIAIIDAPDFKTAFSGVWAFREEFIGEKNFGVASLLYSAVLTKGIEKIEEQIDVKQNPLIGNHGHCTQQFVNLVLTGKASSNCFDGEKTIDDYKIRGIVERSQFGFLTVFQTLGYIQVGKNLKNPVFPIWVICKQFHYHVIFGHSYLVASNNKTEKFDIVYFDGLYNCGDRIRLTLSPMNEEEVEELKPKGLPLIEQVMMTKWGPRRADWNGSTKIL